MRRLWLLLALISPAAMAVPPHAVVALTPGDDVILPRPRGEWTATLEGPAVVEFSVLETDEVFFHAREAGGALLLWQNRVLRAAQVWEIRVVAHPIEAKPVAIPPAAAGCCRKTEDDVLDCQVDGPSCLAALADFLSHPELDPGKVQVRYTVAGLQAQLLRLEQALREAGLAGIRLAFRGATLSLTGEVADEAARRRVLLILYRGMVGKLLVEDGLQLSQAIEKKP
ncbi:MAG: hypothetical protein GYA21_14410 [Myxococcales bacterium]|nr:hypothetical protein [Myxococcales bacterium]